MARTRVKNDAFKDEFAVCDRCGFFLDGARACDSCGEPQCPECGCDCPDETAFDDGYESLVEDVI